jgi:DNA repair exonuclease SbcCD ATPase subunit
MSEVVFESVSFRNFLSFSNIKTTVELNKKGCTFLLGENLDEGGSSGAGKTSVISALSYALFDKVPSGVSKDKLINRTNDSKKVLMEVELKMTIGADKYLVQRCRGASNEVHLWHNGKDITPDSVSAFNAAVEGIVGFSYDLFCNLILFNNNATPFLDLRLAEQRDLTEELLNIKMLSYKAEALKKELSSTDSQIKLTSALFEQAKQKYNADLAKYEADLISTSAKYDAWIVQENERIAKAKETAAAELAALRVKEAAWVVQEQHRLSSIVADLKIKLAEFDQAEQASQASRLNRLAADIEAFKSKIAASKIKLDETAEATVERIAELSKLNDDYKDLNSKISIQNLELDKLITSKKTIGVEITKLNAQLEHLAGNSCPFCKQTFADAKAKSAELQAEVSTLEAKQTTVNEQHTVVNQVIAELTAKRDNLPKYDAAEHQRLIKLHESKGAIEVSITKAEGELAAAQQELDYLRSNPDAKRLNPYVDQLKLAEQRVSEFNPDSNPLITQVALAEQRLQDAERFTVADELSNTYRAHLEYLAENEPVPPDAETEKTLNALIVLQDHQKLLLKLLTDKNSFIRKAIISKTLPFLNKRIAYYTTQLGLPHIVTFQPDMTCGITQRGRELDHGNLSNGEKKRLNLSLCLAFRDARSYVHNRVNILLTDEIDGGSLDEQAVNNIISLIKRKAWDDNLSIFVISHRPEFEGKCDRTLVVRKESGFSSITEQL